MPLNMYIYCAYIYIYTNIYTYIYIHVLYKFYDIKFYKILIIYKNFSSLTNFYWIN